MPIECWFCRQDVPTSRDQVGLPTKTQYMCPRCGPVHLSDDAAEDLPSAGFTDGELNAISIFLRNAWENSGKKKRKKVITLEELKQIVSQFRPPGPLEKMDLALLTLENLSKFVGDKITIDVQKEYPRFYCVEHRELLAICSLLFNEGYTFAPDQYNPQNDLTIITRGYHRLREIQRPNRASRQCFVAMWFNDEMNDAYNKAIKPAIEFVEPGETESRFKAVKIDNVEHVNDINDEIISQIRRSRFMVCDLSGYRGGVYFEAGFAYGLGLDVIYTCRKDWANEGKLFNESGEEIASLQDADGKKYLSKKKEFILTSPIEIELNGNPIIWMI